MDASNDDNTVVQTSIEVPSTYRDIDLDLQLARALDKSVVPVNTNEFMSKWNTSERTVLLDTVMIKVRKDVVTLRSALKAYLSETAAEAAEKRRLSSARWREQKKKDAAYIESERRRKRQSYEQKIVSDIRRATEVPAIALAAKRARHRATQSENSTENESGTAQPRQIVPRFVQVSFEPQGTGVVSVNNENAPVSDNNDGSDVDNPLGNGGGSTSDYECEQENVPSTYVTPQESDVSPSGPNEDERAENPDQEALRNMRIVLNNENTVNGQPDGGDEGEDEDDSSSDDWISESDGSFDESDPSYDTDDALEDEFVNRRRYDSRRIVDEEDACHGHKRDEFNFIKLHKVPMQCSDYDRAMANEEINVAKKHADDFNDLIDMLQSDKAKYSEYDSLDPLDPERQKKIESRQLHEMLYYVPVKEEEVWGQDSVNIPKRKLEEYIRNFLTDLRAVYPFQKTYSILGKNKKRSYEFEVTCAYHTKSRGYTSNASLMGTHIATHLPAKCDGRVRIKFNFGKNIIAIRSNHKHHKHELRHRYSNADIAQFVSDSIENKAIFAMNRETFIDWAMLSFPPTCTNILRMAYDDQWRSFYCLDDTDWVSLYKLAEQQPDKYCVFTFYCSDKTGLYFILKDVIELCGKADALSVDVTYGTNRKRSDLFMINACIDKVGVPFGFMFIYDTFQLYNEICDGSPELFCGIDPNIEIPTIDKPLPQCRAAKEIQDEILNSRGMRSKAGMKALLACALRLVGGTNLPGEDRVANGRKCPTIYEEDYNYGQPVRHEVLPVKESYNYKYKRAPPRKPIKNFRGVDVEIVIMDKDMATVTAAEFALPAAKPHLCQWHVLKSITTHMKKEKKFSEVSRFFSRPDHFPEEFAEFAPYLSPRAFEHNEGECGNHFGVNADRCIAHNRKFYETYSQPSLEKTSIIIAGKNEKLSTRLTSMIKRHSRSHQTLPQAFPFIQYGTSFPESSIRYRTTEDIRVLCVKEMISFCVHNGLYLTLLYLWRRWYCKDYYHYWTTFALPKYNRYTTNMISEGNHSKLKRKLGLSKGTKRLDYMFFSLDFTLYEDYRRRAEYLDLAIRHNQYFLEARYVNPNWLKNRNALIRKLVQADIDQSETHKNEKQFEQDCKYYGTDVLGCKCGCFYYYSSNIHLCRHIMHGLDTEYHILNENRSLLVSLRSAPLPPFYPMNLSAAQISDDSWVGHTNSRCSLKPTNEYLRWRSEKGNDCLRNLGDTSCYDLRTHFEPRVFETVDDPASMDVDDESDDGEVVDSQIDVISAGFKILLATEDNSPDLKKKMMIFYKFLYGRMDKYIEVVERGTSVRRTTTVRERARMSSCEAFLSRQYDRDPAAMKEKLSKTDSEWLAVISRFMGKPNLGERKDRLKLDKTS